MTSEVFVKTPLFDRDAPILRPHRRQDIQGLRALAVFVVVAFHAGLPLPGGFVGVDVFFVISGFVITAMLLREWTSTGRVDFASFYLRRFRRLAPALAVMVTVTIAIAILLMSPSGAQQTTARTGVGAILLFANHAIADTSGGYFLAPAESNPLLNTWSLSVEEQFYLLFPVVLVAGWAISRRFPSLHRVTFYLVTAVAAVSVVLAMLGSSEPQPVELIGFYSPITRAWEFAVGALLALSAAWLSIASRRLALATGIFGTGMLIASLLLIGPNTPFPGTWTLLPVGGTFLLILAGTNPHNLVSRLLATAPMVKIGDWSYSIYLWHWPFIVFGVLLWPGNLMARMLMTVLSLLPAIASYRWIERPLRSARTKTPSRILGLVALTIVPPILLAGVLDFGARNGWGIEPGQIQQSQATVTHFGWTECMTATTMEGPAASDPDLCKVNQDGRGTPIVLVGDSNATHYSEAVLGASKSLDSPLTIETAASCPFIDIYRGIDPNRSASEKACREYYETTLADVLARPPSVVIMAMADDYWFLPVVIGSSATNGTSEAEAKAAFLEDGLRTTVLKLEAAGDRVVLVKPNYLLDRPSSFLAIDGCSLWSIFRDECATSIQRSAIDPEEERGRSAVEAVAAETKATLLDIVDYQCPEGICGLTYKGIPVYMDAYHISVELSEALSVKFAQVITSAH